MTHIEMSELENSRHTTNAWVPEGYDGHTHVWSVMAALAPALFIIGTAAALLHFVV